MDYGVGVQFWDVRILRTKNIGAISTSSHLGDRIKRFKSVLHLQAIPILDISVIDSHLQNLETSPYTAGKSILPEACQMHKRNIVLYPQSPRKIHLLSDCRRLGPGLIESPAE